jgi:hypothetical protein
MLKRLAAACFFLAATGASAQDAQILPAAPTALDTITVRFTAQNIACPYVTRIFMSQLVTNQVIVEVERGSCFGPSVGFFEGRATIGRLPTGNWQVGVRVDSSNFSPPPGFFAQASFTVGPYPDISPISEDLTGYWLTDNPGEGVTIVQSGERAFILFVTYDGAGAQRWLVVSDAKRDLSQIPVDGPARYRGTAYETRGFPAGSGTSTSGTVTAAGIVDIPLPTPGYDRTTMIVRPTSGPSRTIELQRFRF